MIILPNKQKKTFTIKTTKRVYKTIPMSIELFNKRLNNELFDWIVFLKTNYNEFYIVKNKRRKKLSTT